ncbi:MAG: SMC family ATPase, partial [Candidatus Nanopelagicales bacterium]
VLEQEFDSMRLRMERAAEFSAALVVLADAEQLHSVSLRRLDESHRSLTSREASDLVAQLQQRKGRLEPWVGWEASADARMHERMRLDHEVDQAVADLEEAQTLVLSLPDRRASLQRTLTAVDLLAATAQQHRKEVEELSDLATRASERDAIEQHLLDKSARQSSAHERSLEADRELGRRSAELEELLMQQLHERAAVLATALIQGQPCPVCGASEHPHPAQETLEFVSDEELGRRRDELESLREVARQARKVLDEANREVQALLAEVLSLRGAMGVRDATAIGQELTDAQDGLANALSAAQQRSELTDELRHFDEQETLLRDRLQAAASDLALKRAALEQHDAGTASARRELAEILGPSMSATRLSSETDELIRDLVAFAGASEALAVAQRAVPELVDVVDGQAWVLQVAEDHELAQRRLSQGQHLHGQVKHVATGIRRPHELLRRCVQEQQLAYEQTTEAIALADAVSAARGSINKRRMTLQSYAVQRRFESVLEAASLHLARMSAGKYTLALDDQAHGNAQGGLGIKVSDAWTGQDRDPRSLSGGETFYTALSLALGLADVVRDEAGGAQLETLFVDEGFGSLDQEALELVLEQLDALRSGGRVVGVVSHVTEMKEWVNERVDVSVRADRTSTLRVVT